MSDPYILSTLEMTVAQLRADNERLTRERNEARKANDGAEADRAALAHSLEVTGTTLTALRSLLALPEGDLVEAVNGLVTGILPRREGVWTASGLASLAEAHQQDSADVDDAGDSSGTCDRARLARYKREEALRSALASAREENARLREALTLYDDALHEATTILGGEYGDDFGPLYEKVHAARAAKRALSVRGGRLTC